MDELAGVHNGAVGVQLGPGPAVDDQPRMQMNGHNSDNGRKPRKLRKPNDVARCQVDNCGRDLTDAKLYLRRYSVCEPHFKAEWVQLNGSRYRFCQQCNKFQALEQFVGTRRSCKARSEDRNLRRRKQRTDERNTAVEAEMPNEALGAYITATGIAGGMQPDGSLLRQMTGEDNGYAPQVQQQVQLLLQQAGLQQQQPQQVQQQQQQQQLGDLMNANAAAFSGNALQLLGGRVGVGGANMLAGAINLGGGGEDPNMANSMFHQLQLAQLLSGKPGNPGGIALGQVNNNPITLAQQLMLQQAAAGNQVQGGGFGGVQVQGGGQGGLGELAGGLQGLQDLQSLLQQNTNQANNVLLLHNQNVMVLSLDQLGLLGGTQGQQQQGQQQQQPQHQQHHQQQQLPSPQAQQQQHQQQQHQQQQHQQHQQQHMSTPVGSQSGGKGPRPDM